MCYTDPVTLLATHWKDINWASVWKERLALNMKCRNNMECSQIWTSKEKAQKYWETVCNQMDRYQPFLDMLPVKRGMRILDIGGGPGTLAIPLARKGAEVMVVEPAEGMIAVLEENKKKDSLSITHRHSMWEDIIPEELGNFDLTFACFSLGMPDIADCIRKMQEVTNGRIYLVWFSGVNPWEKIQIDLWPEVRGGEYVSGPKGDLLYLLLGQMGIFPQVFQYTLPHSEVYQNIDDAVSDITERMGTVPVEKESIIREYLRNHAGFSEGKLILDDTFTISVFWWETNQTK